MSEQTADVQPEKCTKLGRTIQVRLVKDLEKAQVYYRDVLGCRVDGWGHAERDDRCFILQLAVSPDDVKPNAASVKRATYPTEWEGPEYGWDTFVHIGWEDLDHLSRRYAARVRSLPLSRSPAHTAAGNLRTHISMTRTVTASYLALCASTKKLKAE